MKEINQSIEKDPKLKTKKQQSKHITQKKEGNNTGRKKSKDMKVSAPEDLGTRGKNEQRNGFHYKLESTSWL